MTFRHDHDVDREQAIGHAVAETLEHPGPWIDGTGRSPDFTVTVGIWFSRSDYLSAFVTCFLPIVLLYYPLVLCGENLARAGSVDAAAALWAPNVFMGLIAFWLYRRLLKH